jgi:hypothetical protein
MGVCVLVWVCVCVCVCVCVRERERERPCNIQILSIIYNYKNPPDDSNQLDSQPMNNRFECATYIGPKNTFSF